jgi:glycosyltransferase involved in cell wall biosynthesis
MHNSKPLVTVLLPALRKDQYLEQAVESILNQTFQDFKIFVIADSNFDLKNLTSRDLRVQHLKVKSSFNLSQKLNFGIDCSDSKYLARMDADDVADPKRLQLQVDFLEKNVEIDLLGTGIRFIGSLPMHRNSKNQIAALPSSNDELLTYMLHKNPFFHPTVMIRARSLNKHSLRYNERYVRSQDYELWTRAAGKLVFANLAQPLVDYRLHQSQAGVLGSVDSNYFSSLAKLKYCFLSTIFFNKRSFFALRILPFRLKQFLVNWKERRRHN